MSLLFIVSFLCLFRPNQSIDRTQYSNLRATERQDGYLSFASNNINFPLQFRWNVSTACNNWYLAFANNTLYCLTNNMNVDYQYYWPTAMQAFDIQDGSTIWTTYIYPKQKTDWTSFVGPVLVPPNYAAVFEQQSGILFVLNTKTGNITYKIVVDNIYCSIQPPCLTAGITSSATYQSIFVHYAKNQFDGYKGHAHLFYFDMNNNKNKTIDINEPHWSSPSTPTICDDDVIITTNYVGNVNAFRISSDKDGLSLQPLWKYTLTHNDGEMLMWSRPPLCIPRSDGSFNVLTNAVDSEANFTNEYFELLDGQTGKLLREIIWNEELFLPVINTDQWIMIRTTKDTNRIVAYNVSGGNSLNGNWTEIWNIQGVFYQDIMIVNDYLFLSQPAGVDVFSIYDGKLMESTMIPDVDVALATSLVASVDGNNNPLIITASCVKLSIFDQNPIETVLFAVQ